MTIKKSSGTNNNDWTTAGLQYFLNTNQDTNGTKGYYSMISSTSKVLIDENYTYYLGNIEDSVDTTITAYDNERDENNLWSRNRAEWNGAIALLYASDVGYAVHSSYWGDTKLSGYYNSVVKATSWIMQNVNHSSGEWLLSPSSMQNNMAMRLFWNGDVYESDSGSVNSYSVDYEYYDWYELSGARPVLNLKSQTTMLEGRNGTESLPYVVIGI